MKSKQRNETDIYVVTTQWQRKEANTKRSRRQCSAYQLVEGGVRTSTLNNFQWGLWVRCELKGFVHVRKTDTTSGRIWHMKQPPLSEMLVCDFYGLLLLVSFMFQLRAFLCGRTCTSSLTLYNDYHACVTAVPPNAHIPATRMLITFLE